MRTTWQRFRAMFHGAPLDRELNDEIEIHLAMQEEEFRRQGMDCVSAPDCALRRSPCPAGGTPLPAWRDGSRSHRSIRGRAARRETSPGNVAMWFAWSS